MNLPPWLVPDSMIEALEDLPVRAERAGLGVIVPALESGDYGTGFGAAAAMSTAVAAVLTNRAIANAWRRAASQAVLRSTRYWRTEAGDAGLTVNDPELPERLRREWEDENEDRYRLLRDRVRRETEAEMRRKREQGMGAATLAAILLARGLPTYNGRMRGRAKVIATDQLATLEGLIARHQQRDAGIGSFVWTTKLDGRVRDAHLDLHGKVFAWNNPPSVGWPGQPIGCRCVAVGVVDEQA